MGKNEETCEECLKEMFSRVGEKYPNEELTSQDDWFYQHTWTVEEEDDFKDWMSKFLKKRHKYWSKRTIELEVCMFLLNWGWKNDPLPWEV